MISDRQASVPTPVWRGAFRPFFLLAPLAAGISLLLWLAFLSGFEILNGTGDPQAWHRHEMLFGFGSAAIAGFSLTAIANWTGRPLLTGVPVQALVGLWLAARGAALARDIWGSLPVLLLEASFVILLVALAAREVIAARNRNVPIVGMIALFGAAGVADLAEAAGLLPATDMSLRAGASVIVMLMAFIGGRIIPAFTRNWLVKEQLPQPHPDAMILFDKISLAASVAVLLAWVTLGDDIRLGWPLVGLGVLHLARLLRWQGWRTVRDPLVVVLHLAYLWIPIGLALLGAHLGGAQFPRSAGIHALGAGAMGLLIVSVMSRASLGHTGRPLTAGRWLTAAYALIWLGAAVRVGTAVGGWGGMTPLYTAGGLWAAGMLLFAMLYFHILTRPHVLDPTR